MCQFESHSIGIVEVWKTASAEARGDANGISTHVPGFWSWKGLSSTVRVLMMAVCVLQSDMGAIEAIEMF